MLKGLDGGGILVVVDGCFLALAGVVGGILK
jgi:hypothetical protein